MTKKDEGDQVDQRFSAAFCTEVLLVFHGGALPSGFTFFFIIVSLPLFFVNNKAADCL